MKLLILYNSGSRKLLTKKNLAYIKNELKDIYEEIEIPTIPDGYKTSDFVSIPCDTIMIVGGDGTVHDVISNMLKLNINRNICFIPTGTCNDYSRNFGYNSFKEAIKIIKDNHIEKKTVYKINDSYFTYGLASGGISMISYDVEEKDKRVQGRLAYYLRILKYIFKTKSNSYYEISYDNKVIKDYFYLVLAVDNKYLGGFKLTKKFRNNFSLILFKKRNRFKGCISFTSFILFGRLPKKDIQIFTENFSIKTDANINTDGELFDSNNVNVSVIKDKLNIISKKTK